jgi:predicted nucleic acid-binding protein
MPWLIDANVLLRALHRPDPFHQAAWSAVRILRQRGEVLCYTLRRNPWSEATGRRSRRRLQPDRGLIGEVADETGDRQEQAVGTDLAVVEIVTAAVEVGLEVHSGWSPW